MVDTLFSSPLIQSALVFVLVFTVVFAILQKTKILGDGKKQIDALVALAVGLLILSAAQALDIIQKLVPFMVVSLIVLLVFMLLLGSLYKQDSFELQTWIKFVFGILIFIAVVIAVLVITGGGEYILNWFASNSSSAWVTNGILIVIVIGAVALAFFGGGKSKGHS